VYEEFSNAGFVKVKGGAGVFAAAGCTKKARGAFGTARESVVGKESDVEREGETEKEEAAALVCFDFGGAGKLGVEFSSLDDNIPVIVGAERRSLGGSSSSSSSSWTKGGI